MPITPKTGSLFHAYSHMTTLQREHGAEELCRILGDEVDQAAW